MSLYDDASLIMYPSGYKANKIYSLKPTNGSGDFDFTRASTATRVNADGLIESVASGVPRIDYTGGGCGKLLLEPQRTNLLTYSEQLDNVAWNKFRSSVTANATISPDGITNAEKLIQQSGSNDGGGVSQSIGISNATVYTYSFFAKAAGYNWTYARVVNSPSDFYAWFDLSNGVVGITVGLVTSSSIVSYGNGWYRCSMTFTSAETLASPHIYIANSNNSDQTPAADGVKGIFAYGAQLEQGAYPTSYIPTSGATATRLADACSKTGISSLIGQTEGTLYLEFKDKDYSFATISRGLSISDGTYNNRIYISQLGGGNIYVVGATGGTPDLEIQESVPSGRRGTIKAALAYKNNDFALYVNGTLAGTDTSSAVPACSNLYLGQEIGLTSNSLNKPYNQVQLFKTHFTNADLEEITSWTSFNEMARAQNYKTY